MTRRRGGYDRSSNKHDVGWAGDGTGICVAVVGAGPSGLYAVQALLEAKPGVRIDVLDKLPTPYGLVRYGVAPDNQKIKSVTRIFSSTFDHGTQVRFFGNVNFGVDIDRSNLLGIYDAIIYATGAQSERRLRIPGEDLCGSHGGKEFVEWYNGHPSAASRRFRFDVRHAAVIGAGNVALDVARMLASTTREIAATDVPCHVQDALSASQITNIHIISRRGPAQCKFSPLELRGLGHLHDVDIVVNPGDLVLSARDEQKVADDGRLRANLAILTEWSQRPLQGKSRRVHIHFMLSPLRFLGESRVEAMELGKNELLPEDRIVETGHIIRQEVGLVFQAVGYRSLPLTDVAFDHQNAVIPHLRGRVLDGDGRPAGREYVTGWAKRGPSGIIGTNRADSAETVESLVEDAPTGTQVRNQKHDLADILSSRGVDYTSWSCWLSIDKHELELGRINERPRVKLPDLPSMLKLTRSP